MKAGILENNKAAKENYLTEGNVMKALIIVSIPIIISNMLQSVLEVVDMYFIGTLGKVAIAGGTMSASIIMLLLTLIIGVIISTAAFISRAYGSNMHDRISVVIAHSIYLGVIIAAGLAIIGYFWSSDLLRLLGADPDVVAVGSEFLQPLLMGLITMIILMIIVTAFQSSGDSKTPMYVMLSVNIINIILNPTFIEGHFGIPGFGIAGSAYASILSRFFGIIIFIAIIYLIPKYKDQPVRFPKKWTLELGLLKEMTTIAIPSAIQSGVRSFAFLIMTAIIAVYGTAAIAAYGVCVRLDMLGFIVIMGFGTAVSIMVGQNLGAGREERVNIAVKYAATFSAAFMLIVATIYVVFANDLLMVFGLDDAESIAAGLGFMHTIPLLYWLIGIAMTLGFAMNGAGATRPGMYSAIIGQLLCQGLIAFFFMSNGYPIQFIWYAVVIGAVITFTCDYLFFTYSGWRKKKLRIDCSGEKV